MTPNQKNEPENSPMTTRKIGEQTTTVSQEKTKKRAAAKKMIYIEIDDEVTTIFDRIKNLKYKNIYLVVPKRAVIFQSIVNLKILKRKAEDIEKNIFIITNDRNGIHLATKIGMTVYDKLESQEHPSLVDGKFKEDQMNITPLKASINTLDDDTPMRRKEKKFSISDLIYRGHKKPFSIIPGSFAKMGQKNVRDNRKKDERSKFVLIAPNRQALISLVVVSVIILLTITYIALPGSTITLIPKSNVLSAPVNVVLADLEANRAELDTHPMNEIPSYQVTKKIQKVLTYQATGKEFRGENSRGTVTVVNTGKTAWPLIAKTRFQTADGLIFRLQSPVNVPPAVDDKTPGTLEVAVIADELDAFNNVIGEKGNIAPTRFFLPGLSADNQKKLYAESKTAFSGGKTVVIKKILKEDLDAARSKMDADLKASAQAELTSTINDKNDKQKTSLVLLAGTDAIQTSTPVISVPQNLEGQKLESFEVQGEMVATGIAYNKDELMSILKTELKLKKNPQKRLVYVDENSLTYRIVENDKGAKKIKITANIKGIEEYEISPDKENGDRLIKKIKEHVVGKNIEEARAYIQNLPEIDQVTIQSWPAWAPTLPGIPDNIKMEIGKAST
jgi:hypothetical protein